MSDKEEAGSFWTAFFETAVIKGRNGSFSCPRGRNDQIVPPVPFLPFHFQGIQDDLLVGIGTDGERIG